MIEDKLKELIEKENKFKFKYFGKITLTGKDCGIAYGNIEVSNEEWLWFKIGFIAYLAGEKPSIQFLMSSKEIKEQYKKYKEKMWRLERIKLKEENQDRLL